MPTSQAGGIKLRRPRVSKFKGVARRGVGKGRAVATRGVTKGRAITTRGVTKGRAVATRGVTTKTRIGQQFKKTGQGVKTAGLKAKRGVAQAQAGLEQAQRGLEQAQAIAEQGRMLAETTGLAQRQAGPAEPCPPHCYQQAYNEGFAIGIQKCRQQFGQAGRGRQIGGDFSDLIETGNAGANASFDVDASPFGNADAGAGTDHFSDLLQTGVDNTPQQYGGEFLSNIKDGALAGLNPFSWFNFMLWTFTFAISLFLFKFYMFKDKEGDTENVKRNNWLKSGGVAFGVMLLVSMVVNIGKAFFGEDTYGGY